MTLSELKARVDAAVGGDREIDAALWCDLAQPGDGSVVPAYTSSLDAALGLVEAKLPGWGVEILMSDRGMWRAQLWRWTNSEIGNPGEWIPSYAPTPSLALLSALLSALMAEEPAQLLQR